MKKRALMALPNLTATDEMKKIATSDLPRKEKTDYGYVREVCEYYTCLLYTSVSESRRFSVRASIMEAA